MGAWVRGCVGAWVRGCVGAWARGCVCACVRVCVCVTVSVWRRLEDNRTRAREDRTTPRPHHAHTFHQSWHPLFATCSCQRVLATCAAPDAIRSLTLAARFREPSLGSLLVLTCPRQMRRLRCIPLAQRCALQVLSWQLVR